ncbi:peptidoglycan recognition protein family protein [Thermospira aquatica]|uniref:N-acetylmuramoyl-L-alanine amidase n=1 Tax=Thermospira aquatica TaxID=2828656 RepID=A0AAX3BCL7_9SPIR|nr:peptidoglycan recognition family protein [Thermospira aquatica]URA10011.1 N-acetylmuramoyl-L-alanine amidase [Thermospira aquatica]
MLRKVSIVVFCLIVGVWGGLSFSYSNILGEVSEKRLSLTREYMKDHYSLDTYLLTNPQMIVIHYTVTRDLASTLAILAPDELSQKSRPELASFGKVNIGVHFLVDRDGTVYQFLPLWMAGRHTIGFNHVAFGIENIALSERYLTEAQLRANARLVKELVDAYPSIKYLIGHHEYMQTNLPHFQLYRENYPHYRTEKFDPGVVFMRRLREMLKQEYGLELLD